MGRRGRSWAVWSEEPKQRNDQKRTYKRLSMHSVSSSEMDAEVVARGTDSCPTHIGPSLVHINLLSFGELSMSAKGVVAHDFGRSPLSFQGKGGGR